MMTQEQKAKAYDEALQRAYGIRYGNPSSGTAIVVCEQIFPQLRESEDEKIFRHFHDIISAGFVHKDIDAQTCHDMREWLNEKRDMLKSDTFQNGNSRWKPSEEQMKALLIASNASKTDAVTLRVLYEQLKKL